MEDEEMRVVVEEVVVLVVVEVEPQVKVTPNVEPATMVAEHGQTPQPEIEVGIVEAWLISVHWIIRINTLVLVVSAGLNVSE